VFWIRVGWLLDTCFVVLDTFGYDQDAVFAVETIQISVRVAYVWIQVPTNSSKSEHSGYAANLYERY